MTFQNVRYGERFIAKTAHILAEEGVSLTVGYDFGIYRSLVRKSRPKQGIGAPFDPDLHDLGRGNAFWVIGRNADGDIMHTQALRLLDTGQQTVAEYFTDHFREFPPAGVDLNLSRSRYRVGPGATRMKGTIAYYGEFWIDPSNERYRGSGLSCFLSRYGFWEAIQHWDPDHVVAFLAKSVVFKGWAARAGWIHAEPGALQWALQGRNKCVEGYLGYVHRDDLPYLLDTPLDDIEPAAAPKTAPRRAA
ncbi:MAG: hypothetical protein AAF088_05470 [Pseudomonadota bacterium]